MRDDIYGRLGAWPKQRDRFAARFRQPVLGPPELQKPALEAAWWLTESLDDIDTLVVKWAALKPEIQGVLDPQWQALFE